MKDFEIASEVLKKISSGYKLAIIRSLLSKPKTVSEIQEDLNIEQSLLSHHLKELRNIEVLASERMGKQVSYFLTDKYFNKKFKKIELGCCSLNFPLEKS